jgi:hypothetical protein
VCDSCGLSTDGCIVPDNGACFTGELMYLCTCDEGEAEFDALQCRIKQVV